MLARRLASTVGVMVGITLLTFAIVRLVPGDPVTTLLSRASTSNPGLVAEFRREYGLDLPLAVQFLAWLRHVATGDFGRSIVSNEPVAAIIWDKLGATLILGSAAALIAFPVGIAWGVAAARMKGVGGAVLRFLPLVGLTVPPFSIGLLFSFIFAVALRGLPASGMVSQIDGGGPADILRHLILPAVTLAVYPAGLIARITAATLDELKDEDFVRTARAAGIPSRRVTYRHILPNALLPVITNGGVLVGYLLTGAVFVETVFNWPGIGSLMVQSVFNRDYPVVQACTIVVAATYVFLSLAADLLYVRVDPRISVRGAGAQ